MKPKPSVKRAALKAVAKPSATPSPTPTPKPVAPMPATSQVTSMPARETSIDRLVVPLFKANLLDKKLIQLWYQKRLEYQRDFVALLNERSYLDAVAANTEHSLSEAAKQIPSEAKRDGVDGVLVGEFQGKSIELALRSGLTGRTLVRLTIPIGDLAKTSSRDIAMQAAQTLTLSFPYRGFISATKGNQAKLTMGRSEGLKVGTRLEIFEFDGKEPTFSSTTTKLGTLAVTKLSDTEAVGVVIRNSKPIAPFSKVAFSKTKDDAEDQLETRVHKGYWFSVAVEYNYLDTQTSDATVALNERTYQIPLSPALAFGLGHSNLSLHATISSLSNASNQVGLIRGDASYQVYSIIGNRTSWLTSVGLYMSQYNATPIAGGAYPLISQTTFAPFAEERYQLVTSPHTKLFIGGQLYYPVIENDAANGGSSFITSFGLGSLLGIRLDLSSHIAVEGGIQTKFFRMPLQDGEGVAEFGYGVFANLVFLL